MFCTYEGELFLAAETYVVAAVQGTAAGTDSRADGVVGGHPPPRRDETEAPAHPRDRPDTALDAWGRHAAHANGFGRRLTATVGTSTAADPVRPRVRSSWAGIGIVLLAEIVGMGWGGWAAIALAAVQCVHFRVLGWRASSLRLQVRGVFLMLLVAGLWSPLAGLHAVQLAGVGILLLFDYCLLARLLALAPWPRREPLTAALLAWTLFTPPGRGSIVERRARALGVPSTARAARPPG